MSRQVLWEIGLALVCGFASVGCQATGVSGDGEARVPSFGVDRVPRQSEPEIEASSVTRPVAATRPDDEDESDAAEPVGKSGNLLTRLIPGRDKNHPERKPLPVSKRSSGEDADDDDDFEF